MGILATDSEDLSLHISLSGPSVLDVFRTLVKHLRISIEGTHGAESEQLVSSQDSQQFQESITKTVGEFAGVLPDYHKPDIMNLINSYMPGNGDVAGGVVSGAAAATETEITIQPMTSGTGRFV